MSSDQGNTSYNLSKLIDYVGDNPDTIREMIGIFIQSARELCTQMIEACANGDVGLVSKTAHKLKPSLDIFGIESLAQPIRQIEAAKDNSIECQTLYPEIMRLHQQMAVVMQQLNRDYPGAENPDLSTKA